MTLSMVTAQNIIDEMRNIIPRDINIIDAQGIIIASTNAHRVGQFHAGAKKLIDQELDQIAIDYDNEYQGARQGINLPIIFKEKAIGVIGITGDLSEVSKYGQILKKMTEILLMNQYILEQQSLEETIISNYLKEWVLEDTSRINQSFIARGTALGIDITLPRRLIAFAPYSLDLPLDKDAAQKVDIISKAIRNSLKKTGNDLIFKHHDITLAFLTNMEDDQTAEQAAQMVQKKIYSHYKCMLGVGIDDPISLPQQAGESFIRVQQALEVSKTIAKQDIISYKNLTIELFVDKIDNATKRIFMNKIFRGIPKQKLPDWLHLLSIFYEERGAISEAADRLNMHKNTLQYKIKKLIETTGYDPRIMPDAALFYLALIFARTLNDTVKGT